MKNAIILVSAVALVLTGCVGPNPYRDVDLDSDLSPADLSRYKAEARDTGGHGLIEKTDLWPLGLVLYWKKGAVRVGHSPTGEPTYHVTSIHGIGPLAVLFAIETNAVFDAAGKRLATTSGASVLWGHLAMAHASDAILPGGRSREMTSYHLLHHILNVHVMGPHTTFSLFSAPNPLSMEVSEH